MTYKTHLAFASIFALPATYLFEPSNPALFLGATALGALLPDLDHSRSFISQQAPWLSSIVSFFTTHRGFTHSLYATTLLFIIAALLQRYYPSYAIIFLGLAFGQMLHILGDAMTKSGIRNLCCKVGLYILPKPLRFSTGSFVETIYFYIFLAILALETYYLNISGAKELYTALYKSFLKLL